MIRPGQIDYTSMSPVTIEEFNRRAHDPNARFVIDSSGVIMLVVDADDLNNNDEFTSALENMGMTVVTRDELTDSQIEALIPGYSEDLGGGDAA